MPISGCTDTHTQLHCLDCEDWLLHCTAASSGLDRLQHAAEKPPPAKVPTSKVALAYGWAAGCASSNSTHHQRHTPRTRIHNAHDTMQRMCDTRRPHTAGPARPNCLSAPSAGAAAPAPPAVHNTGHAWGPASRVRRCTGRSGPRLGGGSPPWAQDSVHPGCLLSRGGGSAHCCKHCTPSPLPCPAATRDQLHTAGAHRGCPACTSPHQPNTRIPTHHTHQNTQSASPQHVLHSRHQGHHVHAGCMHAEAWTTSSTAPYTARVRASARLA
jgi:hypothetical protein